MELCLLTSDKPDQMKWQGRGLLASFKVLRSMGLFDHFPTLPKFLANLPQIGNPRISMRRRLEP
jgi:hypothetical protein